MQLKTNCPLNSTESNWRPNPIGTQESIWSAVGFLSVSVQKSRPEKEKRNAVEVVCARTCLRPVGDRIRGCVCVCGAGTVGGGSRPVSTSISGRRGIMKSRPSGRPTALSSRADDEAEEEDVGRWLVVGWLLVVGCWLLPVGCLMGAGGRGGGGRTAIPGYGTNPRAALIWGALKNRFSSR